MKYEVGDYLVKKDCYGKGKHRILKIINIKQQHAETIFEYVVVQDSESNNRKFIKDSITYAEGIVCKSKEELYAVLI